MKVIAVTAILSRCDLDHFSEELCDIVDDFQKNGLEVEIQYKPTDRYHSALIIGYKKKDGV